MGVIKRYGKWYIRFQVDNVDIKRPTDATLKSEAQKIEAEVKYALKTGDFSQLSRQSRVICVLILRDHGKEIPEILNRITPEDTPLVTVIEDELTLWKGIELCLSYPDVRVSKNRERHKYSFVHLVEKFGKNYPLKSMWVPQIKEYQIRRLNDGARPGTVNKEKAALSKMFQVLVEMQYLNANPARMVRDLSEKTGERQVYLSHEDFLRILEELPDWLRPITQTAYYTGMRRGEILDLTWSRVNLTNRIIKIGPEGTKEGQWKRVPIHRDLVAILHEVARVRSLQSQKIFLLEGRTPFPDSIRKPWVRAVKEVGLDPAPTFHDLRHVWTTNALNSGMDSDIREAILGHSDRVRTVRQRYLAIKDHILLQEIDKMTFDHGETEIWLADQS